MFTFGKRRNHAFTLIELLIVIAIILILIAIALPNFLEAQIRARVTKANSEMKTLVTATEEYRIDWGKEPIAMVPADWPNQYKPEGEGLHWWGFASHDLTSPNEYITDMPVDPFFDTTHSPLLHGVLDYPYATVRDLAPLAMLAPGSPVGSNNPAVAEAAGGPVILTEWFKQQACHSGYLYYSAGPDTMDTTVWFAPASYSPTNGTKSFGDIHIFGPGHPLDDIKDTYWPPPGRDNFEQGVLDNCS